MSVILHGPVIPSDLLPFLPLQDSMLQTQGNSYSPAPSFQLLALRTGGPAIHKPESRLMKGVLSP